MVKIRWSLQAAEEFEGICEYLEKNSPQYARLFAFKVTESVDRLKKFPNIGRIVPEIENLNVRELVYKSYRIIYRIKDGTIEIASIFHGSRNFRGKL